MRCKTAERLISLKLDGEITARQGRALQTHLQRCPSCQDILAISKALDQSLQKLPDAEYPEYLHHRIMANLPQKPQRSRMQRYGLSYATATAAILLSLFAGSLVGIKAYQSQNELYSQSETEYESLSFGEHTLLELYHE